MRNEQWSAEQNREATVRAYKIALRDGADSLAQRIIEANPDIDWTSVRDAYAIETAPKV